MQKKFWAIGIEETSKLVFSSFKKFSSIKFHAQVITSTFEYD